MPKIFGALIVLNIALAAFFWFRPSDEGTLAQAKAQANPPITKYQNSSHRIPPPIGEK